MSWKFAVSTSVLALGILACQDPPQVNKEDVDAGTQQPVGDRHIVNAVASAAGSASPQNPGAGDDGPPPNGVFPPGEADKRVPPHAPAKAELIDAGSDPKVKLLPVSTFSDKQRIEVTTVYVEGRAPKAVKVELAVSIPTTAKGDEGKDEPKAPEKGEDEPAEPTAQAITKPTPIHFTVAGVRAHEKLPLPEAELKQLNTLKGSRISGVIAPHGGLGGETFELAKDADESKATLIKTIVDTISLFFSPLPKEPVGAGGYWIASDRATMGGLDLVRYRVTKVEKVTGDELDLSVDLRLYAAGPGTLPPGAPPGSVARVFQGQGKVLVKRTKGELLPVEAMVQAPTQEAGPRGFMLQFSKTPDAQMGQMYQLQYQVVWQPFDKPKDGGDDKDKKKAP